MRERETQQHLAIIFERRRRRWWLRQQAEGSDANGIGNSNSIRFDGFEHFWLTKCDDAEIIDDKARKGRKLAFFKRVYVRGLFIVEVGV